MDEKYTALGKPVTQFEQLDRVPTRCKFVEYHSDQLTSACPITGQPDFYEVTIALEADGTAIETKTLKLYWRPTAIRRFSAKIWPSKSARISLPPPSLENAASHFSSAAVGAFKSLRSMNSQKTTSKER